ncbi:MAG: glycosyltransferase family 9 protein [Verrucomicrobiota bacterium]
MKALIIKPTALGDVAQALLVIPTLKERSYCDHLAWIVDEDYVPLLESCPLIDQIISFPRKRWQKSLPLGEILDWSRKLRTYQFDLVLDLQGLARSGLMTWATGAKKRLGLASARELSHLAYHETIQDTQKHAINRYHGAIRHLMGSKTPLKRHHLKPPAIKQSKLSELDGYIVIHPYSNWQTKLWPWRNYEQVVRAFPKENFILIGKGSFFPCKADNIQDLRGRTSICELIEILANAKLVLSTDSGPTHIAALYNRPIITLFGATDAHKTSPSATKTRCLSAQLKCQPCLNRSCKEHRPMACMENIDIRDVTTLISQFVEIPENSPTSTQMS